MRWVPLLRDLKLALLLAGTVLIAYFPALRGELLLDDDVHVTAPALRGMEGLARIWTEPGATQQYYPLLHTAFWLEHRLWGDAVIGYHLMNLAQHVIASLLVVAIVRRLRLAGAWLAGFIFALHPICVESVAWIAEQKNTLSAVLGLGAALVYLRFDEDRRGRDYGLATVLFVLALLSKTATATLPVVLPVLIWWRRGRLELRRDAAPMVPWIAAAVIAGLITLRVEQRLIAGISADLSLSWIERGLVAGRALWFYLHSVLWPANLTFLYERWPVSAAAPLQYFFPAAALGAGIMAAAGARRLRGPAAALLVFTITLLPVLGFINVEWFVFAFVADHFAYLASLALIVPLAVVLASMRDRTGQVAQVGIVAVLGVLTWRHSATFRDNITLYAHAVAHSPGSVVAHHHLALALDRMPGRRAEAIAEFEAALRLNPAAAEAHQNLGFALMETAGRSDDGLGHLETALRLKPTLAIARTRLAGAYFDRAKALAAQPEHRAATIAAYENALRVDPRFPEAHYNLANLLLPDPARRAEAIAHYRHAVRLKPDFAEAHTNLGTALAQQGELAAAMVHFEAALRANPDFAPARNNLGHAQRQLQERSPAR